jgi:recombinational DNA repair protein (RecF pathway)
MRVRRRTNSCAECGKSVGPTDCYFKLNERTDNFDLVCRDCFELEENESDGAARKAQRRQPREAIEV